MKKTMRRLLLYGIVLLFFPSSVFAGLVPDTGQNKCYDNSVIIPCPSIGQPFYGQDASYATNPASYTKLDINGSILSDSATSWVMVRDNVTGLVWEEKQNMDNVANNANPDDADNTFTWYNSDPNTNGGNSGNFGSGANTENFLKALNNARFGGYSDWRLPSMKELTELTNRDASYPCFDQFYFPNTKSSSNWSDTDTFNYWTSDTYRWTVSRAWTMNFSYGNGRDTDKSTASRFVRAVRGGQSVPVNRYVISDGTVTDTFTGLIWQQNAPTTAMTWKDALAYCEGLSLAGNSDWRLPNINELNSLVDYAQYNLAINPANSSISSDALYWSSTTVAYKTENALNVKFTYGVLNDAKSSNLYVRAVRSGQPTPARLEFNAQPLSEISFQEVACTNIDLRNFIAVLKCSPPPSDVLTFYSTIFYSESAEDAKWFFAQKDILNRNKFIQWESDEHIKGQSTGTFPQNGSWENDAFKQFFEDSPVYQCSGFVNSGYNFLFGFAPNGDMNLFQGAIFRFVP